MNTWFRFESSKYLSWVLRSSHCSPFCFFVAVLAAHTPPYHRAMALQWMRHAHRHYPKRHHSADEKSASGKPRWELRFEADRFQLSPSQPEKVRPGAFPVDKLWVWPHLDHNDVAEIVDRVSRGLSAVRQKRGSSVGVNNTPARSVSDTPTRDNGHPDKRQALVDVTNVDTPSPRARAPAISPSTGKRASSRTTSSASKSARSADKRTASAKKDNTANDVADAAVEIHTSESRGKKGNTRTSTHRVAASTRA
jgi:hypothetical protein